MYQRRRVAVGVDGCAAAAITASATASIADASRLADGIVVAAVAVVVIVQTLLLLLLLLLVVEVKLGGLVAWQWRFDGSTELLLLLLLDLLSIVLQVWVLLQRLLQLLGGHGQQPLPVGTNDLPLVLRVLVRGSSHVAVAQSRWRWRMGRTMATVTLILNLGEEEILLVAVLVRFAGT